MSNNPKNRNNQQGQIDSDDITRDLYNDSVILNPELEIVSKCSRILKKKNFSIMEVIDAAIELGYIKINKPSETTNEQPIINFIESAHAFNKLNTRILMMIKEHFNFDAESYCEKNGITWIL